MMIKNTINQLNRNVCIWDERRFNITKKIKFNNIIKQCKNDKL